MKRKGLFITGTDTDVGKTYITQQIIEQLNKNSYPTKVRKPIESGCAKDQNNLLLPADGNLLWNSNQQRESLDRVTPFRFEPAIAPNRAATLAEKIITTKQLLNACLLEVDADDFLIVEGAGGFYSPLSSDGLNADLAKHLNLNIALVVNDKLGCLNHTLLSLQAIESKKLKCILIVLNQSNQNLIEQYDHFNEIKKLTSITSVQCMINEKIPNIIDIIK